MHAPFLVSQNSRQPQRNPTRTGRIESQSPKTDVEATVMNIAICFYCSFGLVSAVFICCCNLCFYFLGHLLVQLVLPLCPVDTFVLLLCHIQ